VSVPELEKERLVFVVEEGGLYSVEEPRVNVPPEAIVTEVLLSTETSPIVKLPPATLTFEEIVTSVATPEGTVPVLQFDPVFQFEFVFPWKVWDAALKDAASKMIPTNIKDFACGTDERFFSLITE
jgi:hypothetical protein